MRLFCERLAQLPAAASEREALTQIHDVLDAVEDEHSGVPWSPDHWQSDGRMYGPAADSRRSVPGHPAVARYRSRGHHTFVGDNGAIEIRAVQPGAAAAAGPLVFAKPGRDGRGVWPTSSGDPR